MVGGRGIRGEVCGIRGDGRGRGDREMEGNKRVEGYGRGRCRRVGEMQER